MKVKPKEEIRVKDVWYKPGEELPADYQPPIKTKSKSKSEVK